MSELDRSQISAIQAELVDALLADEYRSDYPWYDSNWLTFYRRARRYLQAALPSKVVELDQLVAPLRADPAFEARLVPGFLQVNELDELRTIASEVAAAPLSTRERQAFGRDIRLDWPGFTSLQHRLKARVTAIIGEPIVSSYNFLSLYGADGICAPHIDSPSAKWTLDVCVEQSGPWPLHVSPVVTWPLDWTPDRDAPWANEIREAHAFRQFEMQPGDAVVFAGSSQWHYRNAIPTSEDGAFCTLAFFHYVPESGSNATDPRGWADAIGVPALGPICQVPPGVNT